MSIVRACVDCSQEFDSRLPNSRRCLACLFRRNIGEVDENGCRDWAGTRTRSGYGVLKFGGHQYKAHRVGWELANGPIADGMFACHKCDRRCCVAAEHIFIGTSAENTADRDAKGRTARGERSGAAIHPEKVLRGERNPAAKLTLEQVREARMLLAAGRRHREVAAVLGTARTTISRIARGEGWKEAS